MADGTKMFFAGGWPETVVQPVLKFIHHERGDGIQRKSVFFFYPFKKETRCVAVVPIGGFFFVLDMSVSLSSIHSRTDGSLSDSLLRSASTRRIWVALSFWLAVRS